jgi:hypothetical protein
VARGYERLNRDETGGTLRGIALKLEERLAAGAERIVLDNTYVTRASRSEVLFAASHHGAKVVCQHFEVPVHEAQVNVVLRMLELFGELLEPDAMARLARTTPNLVAPRVHFRMLRELEPPSLDEGFAEVLVVPFERTPRPHAALPGAVLALEAIAEPAEGELRLRHDVAAALAELPAGAPCLLLAWRPDADDAWRVELAGLATEIATRSGGLVELGLCTHAAGPPVCWCRPPLPGLWLAFAERHGLDPKQSVLVGGGPAHATMARALGLRLVTSPRTHAAPSTPPPRSGTG